MLRFYFLALDLNIGNYYIAYDIPVPNAEIGNRHPARNGGCPQDTSQN